MSKFTIWRHGSIVGTYEGANETEALDNLAKAEGFANFEDSNSKRGLTRDDHSVKEVK